jgi:hypothetical protein
LTVFTSATMGMFENHSLMFLFKWGFRPRRFVSQRVTIGDGRRCRAPRCFLEFKWHRIKMD